jgi:RsbT co-antagonist protein rsbRD N-terminal domain
MDQEAKGARLGHEASVLTRLVDLIERNAEELTNNWLAKVRHDAGLQSYRKLDEAELYNRAYRVFSHLGKWISRETSKDEIARDYIALGAQRRKEGFALSEVIQALFLIRRTLWKKVMDEGLLDTTYDLYQAIELNDRVTLFFDRAIFFTAVGYERGT